MGEAKRRKQLDPSFGKPSLISDVSKIIANFLKPKGEKAQASVHFMCRQYFQELAESKEGEITLLVANFGKKPLLVNEFGDLDGFIKSFSNPVFLRVHKASSFDMLRLLLPKAICDDIEQEAAVLNLSLVRIGMIILADHFDSHSATSFYTLGALKEECADFR